MIFDQPERIPEQLRDILVELFELNPADIVPEARLVEDLGLDSIDAVDLVVHLQKLTGRKIPVDTYRTVRTVADLHAVVARLAREDA